VVGDAGVAGRGKDEDFAVAGVERMLDPGGAEVGEDCLDLWDMSTMKPHV
jgi:hypothetical protein